MKWEIFSLCPRHCAELLLLIGLLCSSGCSAWRAERIVGERFEHTVISRSALHAADTVHVYIHGDGRAFDAAGKVTDNPSPQQPYVLELMARDPAPSILLGRPCYFRSAGSQDCGPAWWSDARYNDAVVTSMVKALQAVVAEREVLLIGYSGGGTLAMLMAPHLQHLRGVVTIAANLDVTAWAVWHGYTPLQASLNPMAQTPRTAQLPQVHFFGGEDAQIPIELVAHWRAALPDHSVHILPQYTHACCWHQNWPALLSNYPL